MPVETGKQSTIQGMPVETGKQSTMQGMPVETGKQNWNKRRIREKIVTNPNDAIRHPE